LDGRAGGAAVGALGNGRRDVDLATGRLRVKLAGVGETAKTDAGRRDVKLLPALRDLLLDLKADRGDVDPDAYVFGTARGHRQSESNVRQRILAPAIKLADESLAKDGQAPLPGGITPHALRRTFASLLYALGENPPTVMAEMGHTDPGLALRIYAQAMRRDESEQNRLRALVSGVELSVVGSRAESEAATEAPERAEESEKPRKSEAFTRAAEGARTLDLLHGKHISSVQFTQVRKI
jgi:hypothetical protein